jgi:hypothetical protein
VPLFVSETGCGFTLLFFIAVGFKGLMFVFQRNAEFNVATKAVFCIFLYRPAQTAGQVRFVN